MENFEFLSPTKIVFGRGVENRVGEEVKKHSKKILLHYGGGSIKRTGLYDRIVQSLDKAGVEYRELGGVQPNPRVSLVRKGIELCRAEKIDFILAVGGGSVIDSAKAISFGIPYEGDVWDFFTGKTIIKETKKVGVVLTIAAAGSEASGSCVITNEDGWYKKGANSELNRPCLALMNPELTFTLPAYQTAAGATDIMAHIMERYFTNATHVELTDRLCEGALKTMINNTPLALEEPANYHARAEIMWTGTLAHNELLGTGRIKDFGSHKIEHELSAIYDVAHGAGLAVVFPAWMAHVCRHDLGRFIQFAERVWNVESSREYPERVALEGIERLRSFFKAIGMPTTLQELGVPTDRLSEMAAKCTENGPVGNFVKLEKDDVLKILELAV